MKLLIPDSIPLNVVHPEAEVVTYAASEPLPEHDLDADAFVIWGTAHDTITQATSMPDLRWVQTLAAGPDSVLAAGFSDQVTITGGMGLHDRPVTEHCLALCLAAARRLNLCFAAQLEHRWASELGGVQPVTTEGTFRTLRDARVGIWGFGNIGQTLAPLLTALGAKVTGIARSAGTRSGYPVVDDIDALLPELDLLVMILPGSPENENALDERRLGLLPDHAWVVNVGRGVSIDEDALATAVGDKVIGGAALDVTKTEPLPADSPLWDVENIIITPHAAGGRPLDASDLIQENLNAFIAGIPLKNIVREP